MRDYGKVHSSFWSSQTIRALSNDGRMLALYLMTSPHTTITGTFRLPDGYACEDLGWTPERVREAFAELFHNGFANRCETTKWVWIYKHLDWNPPENPNQRKSALKVALSVPDECVWKPAFLLAFGPSLGFTEVNPSETVAKPSANQEQEQEQEQKKKKVERLRSPAFVKPTVQEVAEHCSAKGYRVDAEAFVAFYASKGWKVGGEPMRDWKSATVTWHKRSDGHGAAARASDQPSPAALRPL